MKLLPSPSISTSTTSFDASMCTSKSATASFLAGILRRILCSHSLPTHPSDQITETSSLPCDSKHHELISPQEKIDSAATTPGIVAKLMGLESLPDTSSMDMPTSTKSISRSRSMNCPEFREASDRIQRQHRRVKSTMSFPEVPIFLEQENEKFLVLTFELSVRATKNDRSKARKCEVGRGELKEKRREKCKRKENRKEKEVLGKKKEELAADEVINKMVQRVLNEAELCSRVSEDDPAREVGYSHKRDPDRNTPMKKSSGKINVEALQDTKKPSWINHKEVSQGAKSRKKTKQIHDYVLQNDETKCGSQDSSPVSVLHFGQFIVDHEVPPSEEDTKSGDSNPRRPLSTEVYNHSHLSQRSDDNLIADLNSKKTEETCCGSRKKVYHTQNYLNLWGEICWLVNVQLVEANWIHEKKCKFEDSEDIGKDIGLQVLDELLEELVHQLH